MRIRSTTYAVVVGFLLAKAAGLLVNLRQMPVLRAPAPRRTGTVSLLVPARNEAARLPATASGLLAQGADETILLDDQSTDDTAAIAAAAGIAVQRGSAAQSRWVGKTWPCAQLADVATGDVLAFCDADIRLGADALDAALAEMQRQGADVFSVFPRQRTETLGERLLVPLIDDVLLCFLPFPLLRLDVPAAATANGSLLLLTRSAYDELGGFESVRSELVEDVALARRARRLGLRLGVALGGDLVSTRMYDGYAATVRGLARGLRPVAGNSRTLLVAAAVWHLLVYAAPVLLAVRRPRWLVPLALGTVERLLVEAKTGRRRWLDALSVPASPFAALPLLARALREQQEWRGRTYGGTQ